MKNLLPLLGLLVLLAGCSGREKTLLPTGFYLIAENPAKAVYRFNESDTLLPVLEDTVSLFAAEDLQWIAHRSWQQTLNYHINLSERGQTRLSFLAYSYPGQKIAFVIGGEYRGSWELPKNSVVSSLDFNRPLPHDTIRLNHICDSLNRIYTRLDSINYHIKKKAEFKTYYPNGKLYCEQETKNGGVAFYRTFYENGDLCYFQERDTITVDGFHGDNYTVSLLPGGRKIHEMLMASNLIVLDRAYHENGQMKYESSHYATAHQQPLLIREFDERGRLTTESQSELLTVCGQEEEFNHPQVVHIRNFGQGNLLASGDLFSTCGPQCEMDSIGTWHFFVRSQPAFTREFQPLESRYRQYCRER